MEKLIKKPYYKYKKDAYSKLNKFGKSLLSRVGFYTSNPNSTHQDLRIGSQFQREAGSVSFYMGEFLTEAFELLVKDKQAFEEKYFSSLESTYNFYTLLTKNYKTLSTYHPKSKVSLG